MPVDAWAAERKVIPSQFILATLNALPPLPVKVETGVVLVDTQRGYAWLQLLELMGLRPDSSRAVTVREQSAPEPATA
jgi:hypothetical protein